MFKSTQIFLLKFCLLDFYLFVYPSINITLSSITADTNVSLSNGDPTFIFLCIFSILSLTSDHMDCGIYILEQAEHFCPPYSNADLMVPFTTLSRSPDLCTKWKFFPPHSKN